MNASSLPSAALVVGSTRGVLAEKRERLESILRDLGRTLVAYSGGVDSTVLLAEARLALGAKAVGVIARSPSLPEEELEAALETASRAGLTVRVVETQELARPAYRANAGDRCYHCKFELFERLGEVAAREGFRTLAYGAVTDDLGDIRPGMAAAAERGVRAPLVEARLCKVEVRMIARSLGLPVWDKPQAACLASRIPIGSEVTEGKLEQVAKAERWIRAEFGVRVLRVRHGGDLARVEVAPVDVARLSDPASLARLTTGLRQAGFTRVEVDPRGYRRADPMPEVTEGGEANGDRG